MMTHHSTETREILYTALLRAAEKSLPDALVCGEAWSIAEGTLQLAGFFTPVPLRATV